MSMTTYYCIHNTPIGDLLLLGKEGVLTEIRFENAWTMADTADYSMNSKVFAQARSQLDEYFTGARKSFSVNIDPTGTSFQKKVWQALTKIPYGSTRSYAEIAEQINNPKGYRAVGMANGKNPIPIIIPCHRVIGKNGTLTGFGGGLEVKQQLLHIEQSNLT
ncbi:methylated-DNA--[protein]-cysteine S-methyltransferase [Desulforhopalus sp. 52FAK]